MLDFNMKKAEKVFLDLSFGCDISFSFVDTTVVQLLLRLLLSMRNFIEIIS